MLSEMAIEGYGYAWASAYGFGAFSGKSNVLGDDEFAERIRISGSFSGSSLETQDFDTGMESILLPTKDSKRGGLYHIIDDKYYHVENLYVVRENGVWREYFTGERVKVLTGVNGSSLKTESQRSYRNYFDIVPNRDNISIAKKFGIREFVILKINTCSERYFYEDISVFSENDIKSMVSQFYDLRKKAKLWGPRFEEVVKKLEHESICTNAAISKDIERKKGAYAINRSGDSENEPGSPGFLGDKTGAIYAFVLIITILVLLVLSYNIHGI